MQKFIVPQFIDIESRIFGPITTRQFMIMLAGLLFGFVAYKLSDFSLFIVEALIILVFVAVVGFVKINGAPFHLFILSYIKTMRSAKIRIWKREPFVSRAKKDKEEGINDTPMVNRTPVRASRLSELSLIIDTGGAYQGEDNLNPISETAPIENELNVD
jgi:PrgI family protein